MDIAYSADYKFVSAQNAVKGRRYYCPVCSGELHFYSGRKNTPHFRHGKGVPSEVKENCELYSQNFGEFSIYDEEFSAQQKVRLLLEKSDNIYKFSLKFPLLKKVYLEMQLKNLYFSYHCKQIKDFELNTVRLLPTRKMNEIKVPLLEQYSLIASNEQYERRIGLRISGNYDPFEDGPLIFKEIQGQYISIPYRKIVLSGKFFVVSMKPIISINENLTLVNKVEMEQFYIYEFIMPISYTDDLQRWFTINLYYSLIPATCHLDILAPINFKKIGTIIEMTSKESVWVLTNVGERPLDQKLIIIDPSNQRRTLKVSSHRSILIRLEEYGDYLLYLDQEMTELITVRYVPTIEFKTNSFGKLNVNNQDVLFELKELSADEIKIHADFPTMVYSQSELTYEINKDTIAKFYEPVRIDLPRIWSLTTKNPESKSNIINLEQLYTIYEKQHIYPKIIVDIETVNYLIQIVSKSDFSYRDKLLLSIRRMGIRMPRPVLEIIEIGRN